MKNLYNESVLVQEMQAGSQEAFTTLYRFYSPQLYVNIIRMVRDPLLTEEIIQELFTRIWHKRECNGIAENFTGYMYRTSQNLVLDFFRKMQRDKKLFERFRLQIKEGYDHVEEDVQSHQSASIIEKAIKQLSPQHRKVYELVKVEGCTYKKAAQIMGISPLTVKEYLKISKKIMQGYLRNQLDNTPELLFFIAICACFL